MISIHQSQFLPWLPYFYKILKSDIFIILDNVQYQKNGVQNRNSIKTPTGESYLTIPVNSKSTSLINEVKILNDIYVDKLLKTLKTNYSKAKYFENIYFKIEEMIKSKSYQKIDELNKDLIFLIIGLMKVDTKIKYSSEFNLISKKDDLVLDLILKFNEQSYIVGMGGIHYMDMNKFNNHNIRIYKYNFNYREYKQLWSKNGFIKNLSIIDLIFNNLDIAKEYILENGSLTLMEK